MKKLKALFYIFSVIGFFTPYVLKFLMASPNENIKILALTLLPKFNIIYFAFVIIIFFIGLNKKYANFAYIAQILFVSVYFIYIFLDYFIITKHNVKQYIKNHHLNAKLVKITDLKKYPNFKIYYKDGVYAAVKILPPKKQTLPFNYKKDRAQ